LDQMVTLKGKLISSTLQGNQSRSGVGPASKLRGGDFGNIW